MSTQPPHGSDAPIRFTAEAASKIVEIRVSEGLAADLSLRVEARMNPGSSIPEYLLYYDQPHKSGDREFVVSGIKIVVDAASLPLLTGTEIGFRSTSKGAGFTFHNPSAPGNDSAEDTAPTYGVIHDD